MSFGPFNRRVWNEIILWVPGIVALFGRMSNPNGIWWQAFAMWTSLCFLYLLKKEIDIQVFIQLLSTFRCSVTYASLILILVCDQVRTGLMFADSDLDWSEFTKHCIRLVIDDFIYIVLCGAFVAVDACKNVSKFTRFVGPIMMIAISVQNIYFLVYESKRWYNYSIITINNHEIDLNSIEITGIVQVIIFCVSLPWRVMVDPNQESFVVLKEKIEREPSLIRETSKLSIAKRQIRQQIGQEMKLMLSKPLLIEASKSNLSDPPQPKESSYTHEEKYYVMRCIKVGAIYVFLLLLGIASTISFIIDHYENSVVVLNAILTVSFCGWSAYILRRDVHYKVAWNLVIYQFRVWVLTLSVITLMFCAMMPIYWDYTLNDHTRRIKHICQLLEGTVYCTTVVLALFRDAMVYPLVFNILLPIALLVPTMSLVYQTLFVWDRPSWYTYMTRSALVQVALFMFLILYSVWKDRDQQFFTLILKNKLRTGNFKTDDNVIEEYSIDHMHVKQTDVNIQFALGRPMEILVSGEDNDFSENIQIDHRESLTPPSSASSSPSFSSLSPRQIL